MTESPHAQIEAVTTARYGRDGGIRVIDSLPPTADPQDLIFNGYSLYRRNLSARDIRAVCIADFYSIDDARKAAALLGAAEGLTVIDRLIPWPTYPDRPVTEEDA